MTFLTPERLVIITTAYLRPCPSDLHHHYERNQCKAIVRGDQWWSAIILRTPTRLVQFTRHAGCTAARLPAVLLTARMRSKHQMHRRMTSVDARPEPGQPPTPAGIRASRHLAQSSGGACLGDQIQSPRVRRPQGRLGRVGPCCVRILRPGLCAAAAAGASLCGIRAHARAQSELEAPGVMPPPGCATTCSGSVMHVLTQFMGTAGCSG